jgi:KaiC/GvpD/RAD55 family RecA-like ATPase
MAKEEKKPVGNKWFKTLMDSEGAVDKSLDPYREENIVRSRSPYLNWIMANKAMGIPRNSSLVLYGKNKSGKSLIASIIVQEELEKDKDAIAISFNTEIRGALQSGNLFGIDPERYITYDVNSPDLIFDKIEKEIIPMVDEGMPLKVLILDSLQGIRGIKSLNADSVSDHLIGDEALTLKNGLKRIAPLLKQRGILFICTSHMAANIGAMGHAPKEKAALSWFAKHLFEYFIEVSRDTSAEGKQDILGQKFESDIKDAKDNKQKTAHRIFAKMAENSLGTAGRVGEFTIDYKRGIINTEDEIVELSIVTKTVERPTNRKYVVDGVEYDGKEKFVLAVRDSKELQQKLLAKIKASEA